MQRGLLVAVVCSSLNSFAMAQPWTFVDPPTSLSQSARYEMVHDSARGDTLLVARNVGPSSLSIYAWNGSDFVLRQPVGLAPGDALDFRLAYDEARAVTVLFGASDVGGTTPETWQWDGSVWQRVVTANEPFANLASPLGAFHMAYDAERQRVVLVNSASETWEFDGVDWTQRFPEPFPDLVSPSSSSISSDIGQRLATDPQNGRVIGLDQATGSQQLWEFESGAMPATWTPRISGPDVFGADRVLLVSAGDAGLYAFLPTFALVGAQVFVRENDAFQEIDVGPGPFYQLDVQPRAVYDPTREVIVYAGVAGSPDGDLVVWEYDVRAVGSVVRPYGTGCGSPALELDAESGRPIPGDTVELVTRQVPIGVAVTYLGFARDQLGTSPLPLPLDFLGATGCFLETSGEVAVPNTATSNSIGTISLTVPDSPALVGVSLFCQSFAPAPGQNPASLIASNGLELRLGDF